MNRQGTLTVPNIAERVVLLGFPLHFTQNCVPEAQRKSTQASDCRLTLLGNTWSVPVVAALLEQLFSRLGFIGSLLGLESFQGLGGVLLIRGCHYPS